MVKAPAMTSTNVTPSASNFTNAGNSSISPAMEYEAARQQLLSSWERLEFYSLVATYVNESAQLENDIYQERSIVFAPSETIVLWKT